MRNPVSADSLLVEHAAAMDSIREALAAANRAAETLSSQLRSAAAVPEPQLEEQEPAYGYPESWLV
ncbi:hypothetical protein [Rhodococcus sp. NPDC058514]|uniref:hypothetical protein n=1 Tax=unclassified Rhodococcus (in: high G+C Gram-positive bacteria) TaxID=192944 RepID=UPI003660C766